MNLRFEDTSGKEYIFNDLDSIQELIDEGIMDEASQVFDMSNNSWIKASEIDGLEIDPEEIFEEGNLEQDNEVKKSSLRFGLLLIFLITRI